MAKDSNFGQKANGNDENTAFLAPIERGRQVRKDEDPLFKERTDVDEPKSDPVDESSQGNSDSM